MRFFSGGALMANRSYLCCCDYHDIYPSLGYSDFDPKLHTLAAGIYAVPITWLAMFRQESLVTRNFDVDGEDIVVTAPISSRELCLDQLEQGIQPIEELFGWPGKLADYASCLRELLQNISGEYVTIELDEIAYMTEGREDFTQHLKNIFLCLD